MSIARLGWVPSWPAEHVEAYTDLAAARSQARDVWRDHAVRCKVCVNTSSETGGLAPLHPCPVGAPLAEAFLAADAATRLYPRAGDGGFG